MSTNYYFAYGSNTNIQQMAQRCPSARWVGTATLPGYVLRFRINADIELAQDSSVFGSLWVVDDVALGVLDRYEGYPHYYTRFEAEVWQDGEPIRALVYMMTDQTFQDKPSKQYMGSMLDGYRECNIPTDQITKALENLTKDPYWDPVFNRIKKSPEREFHESIMKAEYYDLD